MWAPMVFMFEFVSMETHVDLGVFKARLSWGFQWKIEHLIGWF